MINSEAGRCLLCKIPKCSAACAVKTDVPTSIRLDKEGRGEEAASLLFANNPFSAITSRVCDWSKACYGHCVLNAKKMPVKWHEIEAEITGEYLFHASITPGTPNGKKVAIIGAGPAGITAAFILRERGCEVVIYDENPLPGGVLRYGIPEFRLSHKYIEQYDRIMSEAGIEFIGGKRIGRDISVKELRENYDALFIATGAAVPRRLDIPGEDNPNILYALDYLKDPDSYKLGDRVLVIGGGNVTMDASRTALRQGHDVTVYYRKTFENMPANTLEVEEAKEEGVKFCVFEVPVAIEGNNIAVMRKCENVVGADGRVSTKMIEGSDHKVEFDSMLVAISASVDCSIFGDEKPESNRGWLVTDESQQTSLPGVFIAGDLILGPATVVEAVASAKTAVTGIINYLGI